MTSPLDPHASIIGAIQTLAGAGDELADVLAVFSTGDLDKLWTLTEDLMVAIQGEWIRRDDPTECENCATPITRDDRGRPRRYCSDACRQSAYRARKA